MLGYARVAFAHIDDVLQVDQDGSVHVDLSNADALGTLTDVTIDERRRYRAGWTRVRRVRITLGSKLWALDAWRGIWGCLPSAVHTWRARAPAARSA